MMFVPQVEDPPLQAILLRWPEPQEDTWDRSPVWRLLAGCLMLNASNRPAVDRVWPQFFKSFPDHRKLAWSNEDVTLKWIVKTLAPTGCQFQKANRLVKLATALAEAEDRSLEELDAIDVESLPGCGQYAAESHDVFVRWEHPEGRIVDSVVRRWWELRAEMEWTPPQEDALVEQALRLNLRDGLYRPPSRVDPGKQMR